MLTLTKCTISGTDMEDEITNAVINVSGESPHATIRIAAPSPDPKVRKFITIDRILRASIQGKGQNWTIEGESEQLREVVGTTDTLVKLHVVAKGGCQGCR